MQCTQPGCPGSIVDGYCDVCGLAPVPGAGSPKGGSSSHPTPASGQQAARGGMSARLSSVTNRLVMVPLGSARGMAGTRPTRRLGKVNKASRLGAGLTQIPSVPVLDPRQALMDPPAVSEDKRYCSVCGSPVGRTREGVPGRSKGFCPKCRAPFDFDPKLTPGVLLGGQYEIVGALAHGGMGWIYLARDRNVNDRWVVVKGLLNTGDPDAARAAIAEKQYLAEVEHPLIVEIYNFVTSADGASYIIMEYVGGQSLNNLLKNRMKASGAFSAIPLDQAIAYIIEILPAFSYLHALGLLYCDFKPANVIQAGDSIKLIDLGGVRRVDDDVSAIYGTVGFQAPEVAAEGTSVASDIFTLARTLAVLVFEFKGYQDQWVATLPSPEDVPLFAEHDSLYRLLLKATALEPQDRFQSAEEMRDQLLGVLREVTAAASVRGAVTRSTPSRLFETPTVAGDSLEWSDLPRIVADPDDAMAAWLTSVTTEDPAVRRGLLAQAPEATPAVLVERAYAALALGETAAAMQASATILTNDPWDWRGVWVQGLAALQSSKPTDAMAAFNAVYGQIPGELAPKLALARACELGDELDVADRMYRVCATTDAAYVAPAQFGRARLAATRGNRSESLAALDQIPTTSRAYGDSRRKRALMLAMAVDGSTPFADLDAAAHEMGQATMEPLERSDLHIRILTAALARVQQGGPANATSVAGTAADEPSIRLALEHAYREAAKLHDDPARRVALVDQANAVRPRTLT